MLKSMVPPSLPGIGLLCEEADRFDPRHRQASAGEILAVECQHQRRRSIKLDFVGFECGGVSRQTRMIITEIVAGSQTERRSILQPYDRRTAVIPNSRKPSL